MIEGEIHNPALRILEEVGRRRGWLTRGDIIHAVPEAEFDETLIAEIQRSFDQSGIIIQEDEDALTEPDAVIDDDSALVDLVEIEEEAQEIDLEQVDVNDILRIYFHEATRIPLLTVAQEVDLAKQIERCMQAYQELAAGKVDNLRRQELDQIIEEGRAAREQLIYANTRLVVSVARRYINRGLPLSDLIQEGNIGLMRAVRLFDYRRGFKFSTYATWWIRQAVLRAVANQGRMIRLPAYISDQVSRLRRAELDLQQRLNRSPTSEELSEAIGLPQNTIEAMLASMAQPTSLETPVGDEDGMELGDLLEDENSPDPEETVSDQMDQDEVIGLLDILPQREQEIIKMRFGLTEEEPLTLSEVGRRLGITRERARQLEVQALARLRDPERAQRRRRGPEARSSEKT